MSVFEAIAHAFSTLPTGGFSTEARGVEAFAPASQWVIAGFMAIAGANFALLYRLFVRADPRPLVRDEEFRLYVTLLLLGSLVLPRALDRGDREGRGGDQSLGLPVRLDDDDDRGRERGFQPLDDLRRGDARRRHVLRRLGRLDRRLGQGRPPPADRPDPAARARPDRPPGDREPGAAERHPGRRADPPGDPELRPALHRRLRARTFFLVGDAARVDLDLRVLDAVAASATTLGNVGPAFGFAGPMGRSTRSATSRSWR